MGFLLVGPPDLTANARNCTLTGALKGESMKDLLRLMDDGMLYVVVYTKDHPEGDLTFICRYG